MCCLPPPAPTQDWICTRLYGVKMVCSLHFRWLFFPARFLFLHSKRWWPGRAVICLTPLPLSPLTQLRSSANGNIQSLFCFVVGPDTKFFPCWLEPRAVLWGPKPPSSLYALKAYEVTEQHFLETNGAARKFQQIPLLLIFCELVSMLELFF